MEDEEGRKTKGMAIPQCNKGTEPREEAGEGGVEGEVEAPIGYDPSTPRRLFDSDSC